MTSKQLWLPADTDRIKIVWQPNSVPQRMFLSSWAREVLYGGAVSGGKSDAIVTDQLAYTPHPLHRGIILRRERPDLQEVIDRARLLYSMVCPAIRWVETRSRFEFPTGSFILMGSAERTKDIEAYKSFEFNKVSFDELTTFERYQYLYMLSRNRGKSTALPLQVRSGTNPDGPGHGWVSKRLVEGREPYVIYRTVQPLEDGSGREIELTQQFIPATVFDNPDVPNRDEYIAGLYAMGKQLAEALLYGRWDYFRGQMFPYGPEGGLVNVPPGIKDANVHVVRCLDYGWTDPTVVYWLAVYPNLSNSDRPYIEVVKEVAARETNIVGLAHYINTAQEDLLRQGLPRPVRSVIDPSTKGTKADGRSTLDLFQEQGIWFDPANNDRVAGWGRLRQLLETGRIGVWEGEAPYLRATLGKLVREPGKADDLKAKQDDHPADTLRYGVMAIFDGEGFKERQVVETDPPWVRDQVFDQVMSRARLSRMRNLDNFDGLEGF